MGSKSDWEVMEKAAKELEERGIAHEMKVASAHRDPDVVADYAKNAHVRGLKVIIAGAGLAAALPGVVAAHTTLPVVGRPAHELGVGGGRARRDAGDRADAARASRSRASRSTARAMPRSWPLVSSTRDRAGTRAPRWARCGRSSASSTTGWRSSWPSWTSSPKLALPTIDAAGDPRARLVHGRGGQGAREGHRPRRGGVRRRRRCLGGRRRPVGPLRADLVRRPRHRARAAAEAGRRDPRGRARAPTATRSSRARASTWARSASAARTASTRSRRPSG